MPELKVPYAVLVYQMGIANVFKVDRLTFDIDERNAKRLRQGSFLYCEEFVRGLQAAGCHVGSASCSMSGDITNQPWAPLDDSVVFFDKMNPVYCK